MSDDKRLLLEAAAIGAGYKALNGKVYGIVGLHQARKTYDLLCDNDLYWNPLEDDGDAFRLACAMDIELDWFNNIQNLPDTSNRAFVRAFRQGNANKQSYTDKKSKEAAARLAIVKLTIKIGKARQ